MRCSNAPVSPPMLSAVSCTVATSSNTRGSGALRMSANAVPRNSIPRTRPAAPRRCAWAASASRRFDGTCTNSGAISARKPLRRNAMSSSVSVRESIPLEIAWATTVSARPESRSIIASTNSSSGTICIPSSPVLATNSSADNVSRADPPPRFNACSKAASLTSRPASAATQRTCSAKVSAGSRWNCRCWVRLRIVSDIFCGSVVANTNTTCGGGSSSVLSSAASAARDSMCTSSRMYTL